ncbi:hypothetical protein [Parabacteroides distasonis]|uniref:hypothetical protein n=1 Tax=Parabacteroides distasonis TaxID=823 RepID=UPI0018AC3FBF|nr:hypothetical protein [Parabacteroides distasonis]MDB9028088.1 hypothetical protein [Parabacteroides distasonis]MDB9044876.1 hypothetical protein [Parabacteroides distasonis]MDB9092721.1 hypothetical protein [Parabacteroides distasonis]MDB9163151.1 hypothetical protein [Parabacteroides distasonis]
MNESLKISEEVLTKLGFEKNGMSWYKKENNRCVVPEINQEHDTFFIYTDDERYPGLRSKDKYKRIIETQKDLFECYKIAHLEQLINWI